LDANVTEAEEEREAERLLCEKAQKGDREALGTILRAHGPRIYRAVLLPRLGNAADAQDALSQVYMKVVENISRFEWQGVGLYPWLRVIALRVALDHLRRSKRLRLFEPQELERELNQALQGSADELERLDLLRARARVDELLETLNPRYAQAIRLRILEERTRDEVAQTLSVSVATFDVVLHRALSQLKKALAESEVAA
jgi:RNA polymerase sigma factor (sigma-70 family)